MLSEGAIHQTKISRNSRSKIKWNRNFRKVCFENFGQPREVVLFRGNLKIPESFCSIGIPFRISARHSVLVSAVTIKWQMVASSLCLSVQHLFYLRMICRSFDGICTWMTIGMLHHPMLPSVIFNSKTIRNDQNNKLKCTHFCT